MMLKKRKVRRTGETMQCIRRLSMLFERLNTLSDVVIADPASPKIGRATRAIVSSTQGGDTRFGGPVQPPFSISKRARNPRINASR